MAITCVSLSPPPRLSISKPKPTYSVLDTNNLIPPLTMPLTLSAPLLPKGTVRFQKIIHLRKTPIWRIAATPEEALPPDTTSIESSQQMVSTSNDGTGTIIQVLLFLAFIALFILTVGVIYIGVQDFLQKREREKFEKEEASKQKKGGKKGKMRERTGPRGFGQKINEDDDAD